MQRVVIVGAGLGGLRAAESLVKGGFTGELIVSGAEIHLPYNRPPLSKEVLATVVEHERVAFPLRPALADVEWRLGEAAVTADLDGRSVGFADGSQLEFDGLVVASGLRPRRLIVPGPPPTPEAGRHVVRTVDDARALRVALQPGARVVVLGAGFIGCEVAATARLLGCEVTCVAIDDYPMLRPLGELVGAEMQRRHEAHGVQFRLGTGVREFVGDEHVVGVRLSDGSELEVDVVVEAISSHCNLEWLADTSLDLTDGVLCDNVLRVMTTEATPVDGVHVVGDVARFPNPRFDGLPRRVEHWNMPTETGKRAGAALAAHLAGSGYAEVIANPFAPLPAFWSDQYDIRLQSFGSPDLADADSIRVLDGELAGEVVIGYHRGGDLVGVVGLGMLPEVMSYRPMIGIA